MKEKYWCNYIYREVCRDEFPKLKCIKHLVNSGMTALIISDLNSRGILDEHFIRLLARASCT